MIIKTMTIEEMINDLMCDEYAGWTPQGARAMAEYLEMLSDEFEANIEWDRVAIRCDYSEYASWDALREAYDLSDDDIADNVVAEFETSEGDTGLIVHNF